jgi:hypothetical protein
MDTVSLWLPLITQVRVRRVVALRLLYNDEKGRHVLSWRRIGDIMQCSHNHTKDMHERGLDEILYRLNRDAAYLLPTGYRLNKT